MARIVVGVDGSASSKQALRWAAEEAARSGATLEPLMAWENPQRYMWIPRVEGGREDPSGHTRRALHQAVTAALGKEPEVEVHEVVVEAPPARALVEAAKGAALLVVGNRGRGGFGGVLLGSVSFHCVSHSPCPVVVVRGKVDGS